ncbi:MAG: glycosyltransferase family 4 protein [Alicyclobacillaceae bacterium]|nr:glycosyltransferase family 4 protein [Alicyclobacillaceae bacterium]
MTQVAYVSTYVPRKCGLATYTHHLRDSVLAANGRRTLDPVIVMADAEDEMNSHHPVFWPLVRDNRDAYAQMARKVNHSGVSLVSLQHEFGIFGGDAGAYILDFIRNLRKPLVTTFHTVFERPEEPYASIQREIAMRSDRIIVMNRRAVQHLRDIFGIAEDKVVFVPHGTPRPDRSRRPLFRSQLGWAQRKVVMTFGLLSRGKGIELILRALSHVVKVVPDALYVIAGQTHPEVKKVEGESYREQLKALIRERGLEQHVQMIDRYMDEPDLVRHLTACDLYVTPYPGMQQVTSGTLAYAVGLGRPVLSTPYSYAQDLLNEYDELLLPYGDEQLWARKLIELLSDLDILRLWERRMERIGRTMYWPVVGQAHALLFAEVAAAKGTTAPGAGEVSQVVTVTR